MELRQLQIFMTVCETGSFTAAGKALNYAQSTISESIQALETSLGVLLFDRLGRKILLTDCGQALKAYAKKMLLLEQEIKSKFGDNAMKTLRVGITETLCVYKFPDFFRDFLDQRPLLSIDFVIARCEEIPELIRSGAIDVGFTLDNPIKYKDITTNNLFNEEIVFVHRSEQASSGDAFQTLSGKNVIISKGATGYNQLFYEVCEAEGLSLGKQIYIDNIEGIKSYVRAGFGFAFIPLATVERELEDGLFVNVNPKGKQFYQQVKVLTHKDKQADSNLKTLIEAAIEAYRSGGVAE